MSGVMDNMRSYMWTANGLEHTRQDVRNRILEEDNGTSYFLYAMRSAGVKKFRAICHGLDHWNEVSLFNALWRIVQLKRAQGGNSAEMESLVDYFAPQYTLPTEGVWEYKKDYMNLLLAQERITIDTYAAYTSRVDEAVRAPAPAKASSWTDLFGEGLRR